MPFASGHIPRLQLHRNVPDPEYSHRIVHMLEHVLMPRRIRHNRMRAHRDQSRVH